MSIDQNQPYPTPMTMHVPPLPPLIPDGPSHSGVSAGTSGVGGDERPGGDERTNTLALLLPHTSLFSPPILDLLRAHYEQYGPIAHLAPVRAFGRVIVVFSTEEDAERAKEEGDRLWLDVDMHLEQNTSGPSGQEGLSAPQRGDEPQPQGEEQREREGTYFKGHRRRASQPHPKGGLTLRLHRLPPTPLNAEPTHLAPPDHGRNFLISPPGSPPEGWEPIVEDGPNTSTLADDLQRALEKLQLNGLRRGEAGPGAKEVILEEGGVRVEVEDTELQGDTHGGHDEMMLGGTDMWRAPGSGAASPLGLGSATASGPGTIGGTKTRIMPTARPPV